MSVVHITKENFDAEVLNNKKPVLLDFYADWCGPCQMIAPLVAEIATEHPEYTVGKINVDEQMLLAQKFGITSIPALFVVKDGQVTNGVIGYRSKKEILKMFE